VKATKRLGLGLGLLLLAAGAFCQTAPQPDTVELFQYLKAPSRAYGFPRFRFWGWSKDGKIAYSTERDIEGRGGVQIEYVVQDMVSDEVLWSYPDDSDTWDAYDESSDGSYSDYSYKLAAKSLQEAFGGYGIVVAPSDYLEFPINSGGRSYAVSVDVEKEKKARAEDAVASYSVQIARDDQKAKEVARSKDAKALAVYACGYFASPYESRVAIVTAEERFVFEGTEMFYRISGCNLKVGFQ
jgi:hypothetical protein